MVVVVSVYGDDGLITAGPFSLRWQSALPTKKSDNHLLTKKSA